MGVDAKLFISSRYQIHEIITIITKNFDSKVRYDAGLTTNPNYCRLTFNVIIPGGQEERMMHMHTNYNRGGFLGTLLDLGAWGQSKEILTTIAEITGGFLELDDSTGIIEEVQNQADNNIGFLLQQAMIEGKCDGRNVANFIKYLKEK